MTVINLLPLSCAISPLWAGLMLSFTSKALWQERCWKRKGLNLPGSDVFLLPCSFRSSWLCSSRQPAALSSKQFSLASFSFGLEQILKVAPPSRLLCQTPKWQVTSKFQREDFSNSQSLAPPQCLYNLMSHGHAFMLSDKRSGSSPAVGSARKETYCVRKHYRGCFLSTIRVAAVLISLDCFDRLS